MYNLELNKVIEKIKKAKAKKVLIQLPDGLKLKAIEIVNEIEKKTGITCFIWAGSCFGSCDIPNVKDIDLLIQFGHDEGGYKKQ